MKGHAASLTRALVMAAVVPLLAQGQVVINEFAAASSERLLQRELGAYPRVGTMLAWQVAGFDDTRWSSGPGPFGFGTFSDVTIATDLSAQMQNRATSLYLRKTFIVTAEQAGSGAMLQLSVRYNDGFIAFLNGAEVARRNMGNPGMFAFHDQTAFNTNFNNASLETLGLGAAITLLVPGENLLCIQAHNQALAGAAAADFFIQAGLQLAGGAQLVSHTSVWKYLPGYAEPSGGVLDHGLLNAYILDNAAMAWAARDFNDSTWPSGQGSVGIEGTVPPDYVLGVNLYAPAGNVSPSIYTRQTFAVTPSEALSAEPLRLTMDYDDGVIVCINGREVARRNLGTPGIPTPHDAFAAAGHDANGDNGGTTSGQAEILLIPSPRDLLVSGDNVLAVQLHRASLADDDAIARVTLETTGANARVLCQPTDEVRYFVGAEEPASEEEQGEIEPLAEPPDAENDWIELHNTGSSEVSLRGWWLTDDEGNPRKWAFPTNVTIPAGGYLVVLATGLDTGPANGATFLHTSFKLNANGEYLALINPQGVAVSSFAPAYPPQSYLHSYGRDTNGVWGFLPLATPGCTNVGSALQPAPPPPQFSVAGGHHNGSISLALSTPTAGAAARYTLDGSEPNPGLLYTSPLAITTNCVIRACATKAGAVPSRTITHTYLIGQSAARRSLPAICLGGDPVQTYYGPNSKGGPTNGEGLFASRHGGFLYGIWTPSNNPAAFHYPLQRGRASEKPATLEYYPLSGNPLRIDVGLRIAGSLSTRSRYQLTNAPTERFNPTAPNQKPSMNIFFRSEWSPRPLEYPFFADAAANRFSDVRVRAGKNDGSNPFLLDELTRRIYGGTGQPSCVGTFATVYINGVFKGYFNFCERLSERFLQEHHHSAEAWEFSSDRPLSWAGMFTFLRTTNLAEAAAYAPIHDSLDVDNFIDYLLVNTFAAMWDWPYGNWVAARERSAQGRWRFYMWDAEGAFGVAANRPTNFNSFTNSLVVTNAATSTSHSIPVLYTLLRDSPEFRLRFADRAQRHFFNGGCLVKTNLQAIYVRLRDALNPIMLETIGATVNETFYNTWIASDARRNVFFGQLAQQGLWPALSAPGFSQYGGDISPGFVLTLTNPNGTGAIYYSTNGADPREFGGGVAGQLYAGPITLPETTRVQARVRAESGEWSPVVDTSFTVPPSAPTFLPAGSGDWTLDANWSSSPAPYPNGEGAVAIIPPPGGAAERSVNLYAPVTVGRLSFSQNNSTVRNRVRDQNASNTLRFQGTNGAAYLEVGGAASGYVELDVAAGVILQTDLQLNVTNLSGNPDYGALRLRANWSGPGGLIKSGLGKASLTGDAKTFTGTTLIQQGVLSVTQPAAPGASSLITVQEGGQLRLNSGSDFGVPRVYTFGGPLALAGPGRGAEIPDQSAFGKLGALRYDPGGDDNLATVANPILLLGPTGLHVEGSRNRLELAGALFGVHPITKTGSGTLRLSADNSSHAGPLQIENGTLALAGPLGSPITLAANGTITGHGQAGALSGSGTLMLNQTLLRVLTVTNLTNAFVLGKIGSPLYTQPAAAGNGLLALASAPVAPLSLDLYLSVLTPAVGDRFRGGFFVPFGTNLAAVLAATPIRVFVLDAQGEHEFDHRMWSPLANAQVTTVPEEADLGQGLVEGRVLEVRAGGPPVTFAAWQLAAFPDPADRGNPAMAGPYADPLQVGLPNLLRYALGLTLTNRAADGALCFAGTPALPAVRFPFDAGRNDLLCVVEAVTNLADWRTPTILFDSRTSFPPPGVSGWITVSDPAPSGSQRYYRLRFSLLSEP